MADIVPVAVGITAVLGCLVLIGKFARAAIVAARKLGALIDELLGEPAAYGRPARPGLVEKVDGLVDGQVVVVATQVEHTADLAALRAELNKVKHELFPNSGLSLRDAVDRLERQSSATVVNVNPQTPPPDPTVGP